MSGGECGRCGDGEVLLRSSDSGQDFTCCSFLRRKRPQLPPPPLAIPNVRFTPKMKSSLSEKTRGGTGCAQRAAAMEISAGQTDNTALKVAVYVSTYRGGSVVKELFRNTP
ncbi:hypothetical protein J6590_022612 [Homalodisca vitripennis]|nr:hypothetical protein J6590_022612 [Homalodisca vitripennis]